MNNIVSYISTSFMISLLFTFMSMYTYHLSFKRLRIRNAVFLNGTIVAIAYDIQTYIEICGIYFATILATSWYFSITTVLVLLILELLFFWLMFDLGTQWELEKRYHEK